ncbi:MAG: hypothetical protein KH936_00495 [Neisseria sp.]|uniref:hypothetical protein n=1 Tax=Neisseria mucosa TaxID=488 RepID=UPI0019229331|nr:hypothetical protein [Neisseria mucosa]MBS6044113.1 hypothetical protein [Neisseria sp.]
MIIAKTSIRATLSVSFLSERQGMEYGQKIRRIKNSKGRLKTQNLIFRRPLFK